MSADEVKAKVRDLIAESLYVRPDELRSDMEYELDEVATLSIEHWYGITMPYSETKYLKTVGDVVEYVVCKVEDSGYDVE